MLNKFGNTLYLLNQAVFFVMLALFYIAGLKLANKTIRNKKEYRRDYLSTLLAYPIGFLISFFVIDALPDMPHDILRYWLVVACAGVILGSFISFLMVQKHRKEIGKSNHP